MLATSYLCCWDLWEHVQNAERSWTSSPISTDRMNDFKPPTPGENKAERFAWQLEFFLGDFDWRSPLSCSSDSILL